jgi:hypothetical protein
VFLFYSLGAGIIFYFICGILIIFAISDFYKRPIGGLKKFIVFFVAVVFLYVVVSAIIPYPTPGGDWFYHTITYPEQIVGGGLPEERPVLFNILILSVHLFLNIPLSEFWLSQIICIVLGLSVLLPVYLIAERIVPRYKFWILVSCVLSPSFVMNSVYTWPKALTSYFVLCGVYFLLFERRYILSAILMTFGFLAHNYAGIFIASMIIYLFLRKQLRTLFVFVIVTCLVSAPYFFTYHQQYDSLTKSVFRYYPFAVKGYTHASEHPEEVMDSFYKAGVGQILWIRIRNGLLTVTPALNFLPLIAGFANFSIDTIHWSFWLGLFHNYYFYSLPLGVV